MTNEKLNELIELSKKIEECKKQIHFFEYTQSDDVTIRESTIRFNGSDRFGVIPENLWRSIGRIVLNEWKQKLIELENQFKSE